MITGSGSVWRSKRVGKLWGNDCGPLKSKRSTGYLDWRSMICVDSSTCTVVLIIRHWLLDFRKEHHYILFFQTLYTFYGLRGGFIRSALYAGTHPPCTSCLHKLGSSPSPLDNTYPTSVSHNRTTNSDCLANNA